MKRKVLSIVLALSLAAACLVGCGSSAPAEEADAEAAVEEEGEEADAEAGEGDLSQLKIGAMLTLTEDDGGWCQAQSIGLHKAIKELGMSEDQLIVMENIEEDAVITTNCVEQLIDEGCNVIMGCSTGYSPILSDLAPEYEDIQFCQVGAPNANLQCYQMRDYEGMFLLGYLCAKMSPTDELGYSAGQSEASVRRGINAYALGAKYANPNATVKVVWANSWYDPTAEAECANSLIASGITYMGINASSPAIAQACEEKGCFCCGYHQDMYDYAPGAVLVSYVWNWAPLMEDIWQNFAATMTPSEGSYFWGSEYGCPSISDFNADLVPEDLQKEVLDVQQQIINGDIIVYAGELKDNQGNVLVKAGEEMDDPAIMNQEFLVENVIGEW